MTLIDEPGLYRVKTSEYHADRLMETPTLSSGVAKTLVDLTPFHAMSKHPRLNPNYDKSKDDEIKRRTAFGSAAHEMLLGLHEGEESLIEFIPHPDYRTKEARELRDAAVAAGKFPMKRDELAEAEAVIDAVKRQIDITSLYPGDAEICSIAKVDDVWCRCLCDWLVTDGRTIIDVKFTERQMTPTKFNDHAVRMGYDVSAGFYRSILAKNEGVSVDDIDFVFLVVERGPPVVAYLTRLNVAHRDHGLEKAQFARQQWGECLKSGKWPAYGDGVLEGDQCGWAVFNWENVKNDRRLDLSITGLMPLDQEEMADA